MVKREGGGPGADGRSRRVQPELKTDRKNIWLKRTEARLNASQGRAVGAAVIGGTGPLKTVTGPPDEAGVNRSPGPSPGRPSLPEAWVPGSGILDLGLPHDHRWRPRSRPTGAGSSLVLPPESPTAFWRDSAPWSRPPRAGPGGAGPPATVSPSSNLKQWEATPQATQVKRRGGERNSAGLRGFREIERGRGAQPRIRLMVPLDALRLPPEP